MRYGEPRRDARTAVVDGASVRLPATLDVGLALPAPLAQLLHSGKVPRARASVRAMDRGGRARRVLFAAVMALLRARRALTPAPAISERPADQDLHRRV